MTDRDENVLKALEEVARERWFGHPGDVAEAVYDAAVDAGMVPPDEVAVRSDADGRLHVSTLMRERNRFQAEVERLREAIRHEYREARAHRTDNRTALTRLYRLVEAFDGGSAKPWRGDTRDGSLGSLGAEDDR